MCLCQHKKRARAQKNNEINFNVKKLCENKGKCLAFGARIKIMSEGQLVNPLVHCINKDKDKSHGLLCCQVFQYQVILYI